jgi:hypothetical protein
LQAVDFKRVTTSNTLQNSRLSFKNTSFRHTSAKQTSRRADSARRGVSGRLPVPLSLERLKIMAGNKNNSKNALESLKESL